MLGEEGQGPLLRQGGIGGHVAAALLAAEAMAGALVDEDLDPRLGGADRLHIGQRDRGVGLAEMQLHRAVRLLVPRRGDAAAIPAEGGREVAGPGRAVPGDGAAPAIADDAALRRRGQRRGGGPDVEHRLVGIHGAAQFPAAGHVGRRVAQLDAALGAVEQRRADHPVARLGEIVADPAHVPVHPEDLLHHHQGAAGIRGAGGIGGEAWPSAAVSSMFMAFPLGWLRQLCAARQIQAAGRSRRSPICSILRRWARSST